MYLEHLNLVVKDLDETLAFYQAAFPHWQVRGGGDSNWYGIPRKWVHFGDDKHYLTFNDSGQDKIRDLQSNQLGLSHFAFVINDLDGLATRMHNAGFKPSQTGSDAKFRNNLYFIDPNGFEVEFVQYLSDIPHERNMYED